MIDLRTRNFCCAATLLTLAVCRAPCCPAAQTWPKLDSIAQAWYESVFEPCILAVPPGDAPCGPVANDAGDLLCFGRRRYGEKIVRVTLVSNDLGFNWALRARTDADAVFTPCPWNPEYALDVGRTPCATNRDAGTCWIRSACADGTKRVVGYPIRGITSYGKLRALPSRHRWIFTFFKMFENRLGYHPCLVYSDDDGRTWSQRIEISNAPSVSEVRAPDKSHRWDTGSDEPDLIELRNGTVLMVVRTGTDHHAWYESKDGGLTWSAPFELPAFWAYNTMPLLFRLRDGRLLFFWNNTQILPRFDLTDYSELSRDEVRGKWEAVFTNRDALHVAISEDEGRTWIGFRELTLNGVRNREDYRETGNEFWQMKGGGGIDKSVHQTQAVELPGGKVALTCGQSVSSRRVVIFDVKWLYEKSREEDFRRGTENLSNHLFLKSLLGSYRGWSGHAAMNRIPGAAMVREPGTDANTKRECLQICRIRDERLIDDRQGVAWNFPAARKGRVSVECRVDGAGALLSLCDHWINPCDWSVRDNAMCSFEMDASFLGGAGHWSVVALDWDQNAHTVKVSCGDRVRMIPLRTQGFSPYGISYLHLQTLAEGHDSKGSYFRWFRMRGE